MKHLRTFQMIEEVSRAGSIRKAAEDMNLTSSALNRLIQRFEDEFGSPIFERMPRGVRLNTAGEMLVQHYKVMASDLARVQSQVADLAGARRGHVSIACSQALLPYFLPAEIARYRAEHPGVTFSVEVRDRAAAERDLGSFNSDLALVFEPVHLVDFEVIADVPQVICAMMAPDHPLARVNGPLRLREALAHPHVVPTQAYGVRHVLEQATRRMSRGLQPVAESSSFEFMRHYVQHERAVGFQIPIGLRLEPDAPIVVREIAARDVPPGHLLLGQRRGRTLPVASARFGVRLSASLSKSLDDWCAAMG
ncbi:MAG: LysR family transcriptional regulator [Pseudomonadota bacterium]